jgi:Rho termination factor, N-terminal domain
MAVTYEQLQKKTVAELREMAKGIDHEAVQGYTQMNKEHLIPAICKALGIESHVHHHVTDGFDKSRIKARIHALKIERDRALETHDHNRLHMLRRELHTLNHRIRSHMA